MADIFLSYAREDLVKAKLLAEALEKQGWSVWWDRSNILPGQNIDRIIKAAIAEAKCLIVMWTQAAYDSNWVSGEANLGLRRNMLVQIHLGEFDPPINFQGMHSEDFSNWQGETDKPEFRKLFEAIKRLVGDPKPKQSNPVVNKSKEIPKRPPSIPVVKKPKQDFEPEMVIIPAGSFQMGSKEFDYAKPIHTVTFNALFALGKYPVTFAEYEIFAQQTGRTTPNDRGWGRDRRPVINVSWQDAKDYAIWLSQVSGKAYRLPSEAEWEYACRAGSQSRFFWGDDETATADYAWFADNSSKTHPIGEKQANPWGLYDMTGNVWEWLQDTWHENYQRAPVDGSAWETNGYDSLRVLRGGSWLTDPSYLRSAYRHWDNAVDRLSSPLGFRLAQDLP